MIQLGLLGASGRMGQQVSSLIQTEFSKKTQLIAHVDRGDPLEPLLEADVVIDFSSPAAMLSLVDVALRRGGQLPAFVVGSTGWKNEERHKLRELAMKTPILISSNFSTGVLALLDILRKASPILKKLGYTPSIAETHHVHKKDAPSGTALFIQRAISPDHPETVETHSIRSGEVIGDHEVTFQGISDHLTFGHFAQDRSIFARGAIEVALWMALRRKGPSPLQGFVGIEMYFEEIKA